MSWTLTLHGANELPNTVNPVETIVGTVDALTDYDSVDLGYYGAEPNISLEGDDLEYFSGLVTGKNSVRVGVTTELEAISYPSSVTSYLTLYDIIPVLKLKYNWVTLDTTNDKISFHSAGQGLLVTVDVTTEYDKELAKLKMTLDFKKGLRE